MQGEQSGAMATLECPLPCRVDDVTLGMKAAYIPASSDFRYKKAGNEAGFD
jgi:hypothetical protein